MDSPTEREAEMEHGHLDDWGYEQDELQWMMIRLFRANNLQ